MKTGGEALEWKRHFKKKKCLVPWHSHRLSSQFERTILSIFQKNIRDIGVLSKIRHFVYMKTLVQLCHAIILPLLSYGCIF